MRLTETQKLYRLEREKADRRRRARMAPIMREAKRELDALIEACRPRKGRPRKKGDRNTFVIIPRDPLDL